MQRWYAEGQSEFPPRARDLGRRIAVARGVRRVQTLQVLFNHEVDCHRASSLSSALARAPYGKYIVQNRPGQLLPTPQSPAAAESASRSKGARPGQGKRVFVAQSMDAGRISQEQEKALD